MATHQSMTEGTPWKLILKFSIPLLFGQIFQLFYSLVDTKIVGIYLGETALAAVGSVSMLYHLLINFGNYLTIGFAIAISIAYGAGKYDDIRKSFGHTILLTFITIISLSIILLLCLNPILKGLNVPAAQLEMARTYIGILMGGLIVSAFYNMFANTLRSLGDSVTPLIFLIISSLVNALLDYLLVAQLHAGVAGAALATVMAQLLSVILCYIRVRRKFPLLHTTREDFRLEKPLVSLMYKNGLSMAFMSCLVGFASVALQSAVNTLGTEIIVVHTAAKKMHEIMGVPFSVMGSAMATFGGQNYGAGRMDRIKDGLKTLLAVAIIWTVLAIIVTRLFADPIMAFLASTSNPEIIHLGALYMKVEAFFLWICILICGLRNMLQTLGYRIIPIVSSIIELIMKIIFATIFVKIAGYYAVIWTEPLIWCVMIIPMLVKLYQVFKKK